MKRHQAIHHFKRWESCLQLLHQRCATSQLLQWKFSDSSTFPIMIAAHSTSKHNPRHSLSDFPALYWVNVSPKSSYRKCTETHNHLHFIASSIFSYSLQSALRANPFFPRPGLTHILWATTERWQWSVTRQRARAQATAAFSPTPTSPGDLRKQHTWVQSFLMSVVPICRISRQKYKQSPISKENLKTTWAFKLVTLKKPFRQEVKNVWGNNNPAGDTGVTHSKQVSWSHSNVCLRRLQDTGNYWPPTSNRLGAESKQYSKQIIH